MSKVFAHRGFSAKYPENTMLAFRQAVDCGCDGIELDVHPTKDGTLVIIHDEDVKRTTDGAGLVKEFTLEELRKFNAAAAWGGQFGFEPIPTLEEYFDYIKDTPVVTNIELKNGIFWYEGMEEQVIRLVRRYHLEDRLIFSSFNHYSIEKCKELAPDIPRGLLCDCWIIQVGAYTKGLDAQYVHPHFRSLTPQVIEEIRANARGINTWTVNDPADMRRLIELDIEGIISNDPQLLRETVDSMAGRG